MTRTLLAGTAVTAALLGAAAAQDGAPRGPYFKFFGGAHEPVGKRTSTTLPSGFSDDYLDEARRAAALGAQTEPFAGTPLGEATRGFARSLEGRRGETEIGFLGGAAIGMGVTPRLTVELEAAHRTHEVAGGTGLDAFEANRDALTAATRAFVADGSAGVPTFAEAADEDTTIAVTTYMANAVYALGGVGPVTPFVGAGVGYASPAGDISDYDGNVAYQVRAGADIDLGPVLVGVQATYVGAGDFEAGIAPVNEDLTINDRLIADDVAGKSTVEYQSADVAVTLTVPFGR